MKHHLSTALLSIFSILFLSQCMSLEDECRAVIERDLQIVKEQKGDYYIGRRYYVPGTRFWGYLRKPAESWSSARLVLMSESLTKQPDRGPEPPRPNAVYGSDNNVEYIIYGEFDDGPMGYDPNSNQPLPVFKPTRYVVRDRDPGFLFTPTEERKDSSMTLFPSLVPSLNDYSQVGLKPVKFETSF